MYHVLHILSQTIIGKYMEFLARPTKVIKAASRAIIDQPASQTLGVSICHFVPTRPWPAFGRRA